MSELDNCSFSYAVMEKGQNTFKLGKDQNPAEGSN